MTTRPRFVTPLSLLITIAISLFFATGYTSCEMETDDGAIRLTVDDDGSVGVHVVSYGLTAPQPVDVTIDYRCGTDACRNVGVTRVDYQLLPQGATHNKFGTAEQTPLARVRSYVASNVRPTSYLLSVQGYDAQGNVIYRYQGDFDAKQAYLKQVQAQMQVTLQPTQ